MARWQRERCSTSPRVPAFLATSALRDGLLHVWVPHATAGLAVLETGAGSDDDLLAALRELLPADDRWRHRHGSPGHGRDHVLPALCPPYATVPVVDGPDGARDLAVGVPGRPQRRQPAAQVRLSFLAGLSERPGRGGDSACRRGALARRARSLWTTRDGSHQGPDGDAVEALG